MTPAISDLARRLNEAMNRQPHSSDGVVCAHVVEQEVIALHNKINELFQQLEVERRRTSALLLQVDRLNDPPQERHEWHVDEIAADAEAHVYSGLSRGRRRVALCGYEPDPTAPLYRVALPPRMFLCEACQVKARTP